jgi:alpha-tubulin suppressor-like RCC1 family protein
MRRFGLFSHVRKDEAQAWRGARTAAALLLSASLLTAAPAAFGETSPTNTALPTVSGTQRQGAKLNSTNGSWTGGGLSFTYQWQTCPTGEPCAAAKGETAKAKSYEPIEEDVGQKVRLIVTATNKINSAEATSAQTGLIEPLGPKNLAAPTISGVAKEGQLLTASTGEWEGTHFLMTYSYQWERCDTEGKNCTKLGPKAIEGETAKEEEERKQIEQEEAESEEGPKQPRYVVATTDVGHTVRVTVTDVNPAGTATSKSLHTETVTDGPPVPVNLPSMSGNLRQGGTLTANKGVWRGTEPIEYSYKWESCNAEHACAETSGSTLTLGEGDVGNTIRAVVTAKNEFGTVTASSIASPAVIHANDDFAVAWGEDYRGQLGTVYRNLWEASPVLMEGQTGITAIASASAFTLLLHEDGTVTASGGDIYGQLGDESTKATWEKGVSHVAVHELSEAKSIAADATHALAIRGEDTVVAWGGNTHGQNGNGRGGFESETGENGRTPKEVKPLKEVAVSSIATGGGADFAVLASGEVLAWGNNHSGQLGVAWPSECKKLKTCEEKTRKRPSEELEGGEKRQIELTQHLCKGDAGWDLCSKVPRPLVEANEETHVKGVVTVAAGGEAAYALTEGDEVLSWGGDQRSSLGQTVEGGTNTNFTPPGPVMVNGHETLKHVVAIAAGYRHALALLENGSVVGWGDNSYGALGTTSGEECTQGGKSFPCDKYATTISALSGVHAVAIVAGIHTSAVLGENGKVYTVGSNKYGQLGRGPACENEGGKQGTEATCFNREWKAVPGLEHVRAISGNGVQIVALVSHEAAPPFPLIASEAKSKSLKLEWSLPEAEPMKSLHYRVWEHPGNLEVSEGGESEGGTVSEEEEVGKKVETEEEETETGSGTAPTNETLPLIKVYELVEGKRETVRKEAALGQILEATSGAWKGSPLPEFSYQWLRCKSKCSWIPGAKGTEYTLTEEDVGYTIEVTVSAHNGTAPRGHATSEPTPTVKAESESGKSHPEAVSFKAEVNNYLMTRLAGKSLEPVEYELDPNSRNPVHNVLLTRVMLATPLP